MNSKSCTLQKKFSVCGDFNIVLDSSCIQKDSFLRLCRVHILCKSHLLVPHFEWNIKVFASRHFGIALLNDNQWSFNFVTSRSMLHNFRFAVEKEDCIFLGLRKMCFVCNPKGAFIEHCRDWKVYVEHLYGRSVPWN